eukprot:2415360-Rhodomonas_salina.1
MNCSALRASLTFVDLHRGQQQKPSFKLRERKVEEPGKFEWQGHTLKLPGLTVRDSMHGRVESLRSDPIPAVTLVLERKTDVDVGWLQSLHRAGAWG